MMCEIDVDTSDVWRESFPCARMPYRCRSCQTVIAAGEQHMAVFSVFDGNAGTERVCAICAGLWRHFADHHRGGPMPGDIVSALLECLDGIGEFGHPLRHVTLWEREDVDVRNWRLSLAIIRRRRRAAKRNKQPER